MAYFDSTIPLRLDPYRFLRRTAEAEGSDIFETRLLLERAVCLTGHEGARFFYDTTLFRRADAAPVFLKKTLFGEGGVQGLDDAAHRHRKALFIDLLGPGRADGLTAAAVNEIAEIAGRGGRVVLQDALEEALARAVCRWAGIPDARFDDPGTARTLSAMFEHAGSVGFGQIVARQARSRGDQWAEALIRDVRGSGIEVPEETPLYRVAHWQDVNGDLLAVHVAAVELLNVLRPFVAVATYLTFAAHALATRTGEVAALARDPSRVPGFVLEVRRFYPFFPVVAARACRDTEWHGHPIPEGRLTVLDIHGTNRDPAVWDAPDTFRPERFEYWRGDPFTMIPQGGGDHAVTHRCAGEWVTGDLMEAGVRALISLTDWNALPAQDLSLDMRDLPALPRDRLVLDFG